MPNYTYDDYLSGTYLPQQKPQSTGFDLSDSLEKVAQGYIAGFTTFEFGEKPKSTSEAIFYNIGHLLGFMGYVPNPLGIAGKIGLTSLARSLKFGKLEKMMVGAPTILHARSLPMLASEKIMGGIMKATAASPALESLSFLKNQTTRDVLKGAAEMGIASGVASWQQGVDGVLNGIVSGAEFGAFNRFLGNMIGRGGKISPGTNAFPSDPKQAEFVDNMTRALSSSIFMGMQSTMAGAPLELQIYEYLLNGVFGYKEMPWWKREALGVIRQYDRPGFRHKLYKPETEVIGFEKLDKRVQDELQVQADLLTGGSLQGTISNAAGALAGSISDFMRTREAHAKQMMDKGGWTQAQADDHLMKSEANWYIFNEVKENLAKGMPEEQAIAEGKDKGSTKFVAAQNTKSLFERLGFKDPLTADSEFLQLYRDHAIEWLDRFDKSGVSKYFRDPVLRTNNYFAQGLTDPAEVNATHDKAQEIITKYFKTEGQDRLTDANWDGMLSELKTAFPDKKFDNTVPEYKALRQAFVSVKDSVEIPVLQMSGNGLVWRPEIDPLTKKKNLPLVEPETQLHRTLPANPSGGRRNVFFIKDMAAFIDQQGRKQFVNPVTNQPLSIYEAIDQNITSYEKILMDLHSKGMVFYGGLKDKAVQVAGFPYIKDTEGLRARWKELSTVFPELNKDIIEFQKNGKTPAQKASLAEAFAFHAVNNAEFAKAFNGVENYAQLNNKEIVSISPQKYTKRMQVFATRNPLYTQEAALKAGLNPDGVRFVILNAVNKDGSGHFGGPHETYLDQNGEAKPYDQGWDGGTFLSHKMHDALAEYFGLDGGFLKGLQIADAQGDGKFGFLSKLGFHRASDNLNQTMVENGWDMMHFDTTAKQSGGRKSYDWDYTAGEPVKTGLVSPNAKGEYNIYAGTNENAILSNLHNRPFVYQGEQFQNVEQFFQLAKFRTAEVMSFDYEAPDAQKKADAIFFIADRIAAGKSGGEAKRLGGTRIPGVTFNEKVWNEVAPKVMKEALRASFEQNPDALNALLETGKSKLTHIQDRSRWGKDFPKLLSEVRDEFAAKKGIGKYKFRVKGEAQTEKLPWETVNVAFGEENHTADLVKQVLTNVDPNTREGAAASKSLQDMLLTRFNGSAEANAKFDEAVKADNADGVDFEEVGLSKVVELYFNSSKPSKVFDALMRHIFKVSPADGLEATEDKPSEASLSFLKDMLKQQGSFEALSPFVKEFTPAMMRGAHGIREYAEAALTRFVINRAVAPRMAGSFKAVVQPHDPGAVLRVGGVKEGMYYLGDNHKDSRFQLPNGEWTTYEKAYKDVQAGKLDASVLDHVVIRVPADSPSGVRVLKFGGFTGLKSHGVMLHHKEYMRLGGADNDADGVFVYQNLPKAAVDYFRAQKDRNRLVPIRSAGQTSETYKFDYEIDKSNISIPLAASDGKGGKIYDGTSGNLVTFKEFPGFGFGVFRKKNGMWGTSLVYSPNKEFLKENVGFALSAGGRGGEKTRREAIDAAINLMRENIGGKKVRRMLGLAEIEGGSVVYGERPIKDPKGDEGLFIDPTKKPGKTPFNPIHYMQASHWSHNGNAALSMGLSTMDNLMVLKDSGVSQWKLKNGSTVKLVAPRALMEDFKAKFVQYGADASDGTPIYSIDKLLDNVYSRMFEVIGTGKGKFNPRNLPEMKILTALNRAARGSVSSPGSADGEIVTREIAGGYKFTNAMAEFVTAHKAVVDGGLNVKSSYYNTLLKIAELPYEPVGKSEVFGSNAQAVIKKLGDYLGDKVENLLPFVGDNISLRYPQGHIERLARTLAADIMVGKEEMSDGTINVGYHDEAIGKMSPAQRAVWNALSKAKEIELVMSDYEQLAGATTSAYYGKRLQEAAKKSEKYDDVAFWNGVKNLQSKARMYRSLLKKDRTRYPYLVREILKFKQESIKSQEGRDYFDALLVSPRSQGEGVRSQETFLMTGEYMNGSVLGNYYNALDVLVRAGHEGAPARAEKVQKTVELKTPEKVAKAIEQKVQEDTGEKTTMVPPAELTKDVRKFFMKAGEIAELAKGKQMDPEVVKTANRIRNFFEKNSDLLPKMEDMFYAFTHKRDGIPLPIESATKEDLGMFADMLETLGKKNFEFNQKYWYMFGDTMSDLFAPYQERNFYKRRMSVILDGVQKDVQIAWPMSDMDKINNLNNARATAEEMTVAQIEREILGEGGIGPFYDQLKAQGVAADIFEYAVMKHDSDMEPSLYAAQVAKAEKLYGHLKKRTFTVGVQGGGTTTITFDQAVKRFEDFFRNRADNVRKNDIIKKDAYVKLLREAAANRGWLNLGWDNKDNVISKLAVNLLELDAKKVADRSLQLGEFGIDFIIHQAEAQHYRFPFDEAELRKVYARFDKQAIEDNIARHRKLGYVKAVDLPESVRYDFLNAKKRETEAIVSEVSPEDYDMQVASGVPPESIKPTITGKRLKYRFLTHDEFDGHLKQLATDGVKAFAGGRNEKTGIYEPGFLDQYWQDKASKYFPRTADADKAKKALEKEFTELISKIKSQMDKGNHSAAQSMWKALVSKMQEYNLRVGEYEFGDTHQLQAIAALYDNSERSPQELERLGMHKRSRHLEQRDWKNPSLDYEKSIGAWIRYEKDIRKKYLDKVYALTSEFIIRRFEDQTLKGRNGIGPENAKAWANFMRVTRRDNLGYPSMMPEEFMTNPEYKIKGTPYAWTQSQYWSDRYNEFIDRMKLPESEKVKDFNDARIAHKLSWISQMDGKLSLVGLLSTPKSSLSNALGGNANTLINVGIGNYRRALDYKLLSTFKPEWTTREAVERDFQSTGILEQFYKEFANLASTAGAENVKRFFRRASEVINKDPNAPDKTLMEIAKEEGLTDKFVEVGASFMRVAERQSRRTAAVSAYIKAREMYAAMGYEFKQWDDPLLMDFVRRYVSASQFLYNTANRPAFARTELGKMFTRFSLWGWRSVSFRNNIYLQAKEFGFRETAEETQRLSRMLSVDLFLMGLASVFPFSVFNATVPPPLSHFANLSAWMFGDQKEKEAAYFGILPYPANIFNGALPPFSRYLTSFIPLMTGDLEKFTNYYMWTMLPFGRFMRDTGRALYNPSLLNERMFGIPSLTLGEYLTKVKNDKVGTQPHAYGALTPFINPTK